MPGVGTSARVKGVLEIFNLSEIFWDIDCNSITLGPMLAKPLPKLNTGKCVFTESFRRTGKVDVGGDGFQGSGFQEYAASAGSKD